MKNNHEAPNGTPELQDSENSFTKMANETPSFEEHMKQYKEEHPDAVEDINKAWAMAKSTNTLETRLAKIKKLAQEDDDFDDEYASYMSERHRSLADEKAEKVAMDFEYQTKQREALARRLEEDEKTGRIEDIEKARAMAGASDWQETFAAKTKAAMNDLDFDNDPGYFYRYSREVNYERARKAANRRAEEAAQKYDEEHKIK